LKFDISNVTNVDLVQGNLKQAGVVMYQSIYVTVYAINVAGRGPASIPLPIIVLKQPDPVTNLVVMPSLGPRRFNVSWDAPADVGLGDGQPPAEGQMYRYVVTISDEFGTDVGTLCYGLMGELCDQCSCPFKQKKMRVSVQIASSDDDANEDGVVFIKGTSYTFAVALQNDADIGDPTSASSCAIEKADPPQNPTGIPSGLGEVTLNWYTPLDTGAGLGTNCTADRVILWLIEASMNEDFVPLIAIKPVRPGVGEAASAEAGGLTLSLAPVEGNSFTIGGLTKGNNYYFRVYTENNAGSSLESVPVRVQPVGLATAPLNVRSRVNGNGVVISFDGPVDTGMGNTYINVSCYFARASRSLGSVGDAGECEEGKLQSLAVSGLQSGTIYYFTVSARTSAGDGDTSSPVIERYIGIPGAPQTSSALLLQSGVNELTFTWLRPSDSGAGSNAELALSDYVVMISTVPDNFNNATSYRVPAVELHNEIVSDEPVLETYTDQGQYELSSSSSIEFATCALEGEFCSCYGTMRYGTDETYAMEYVKGGAFCTDDVFGNVAPGLSKYCSCKPGTTNSLFRLSSAPIVNESDPCSCRSLCQVAPSDTLPSGLQNKAICALHGQSTCLDNQKVGQTAVFGTGVSFCNMSGIDESCSLDNRLSIPQGGTQYVRECVTTTQSRERNLNQVSFTATGLEAGALYFFKVQAQNFVGLGPSLGSDGSINMQSMQLPSAPSNLTVTAQGDLVLLSWFVPVDTGYGDGSNELENYLIERVSIGTTGTCFSEVDASRFVSELVPASKLTFTTFAEESSARPITCFRVYAVNQVGQGPPSLSGKVRIMQKPYRISEDDFIVQCQAQPAPPVAHPVHLEWVAPFAGGEGASITGYEVQTSLDDHFTFCQTEHSRCDSTIVTSSSSTVCSSNSRLCYGRSDLVRGQTYYFRVRAWNARGPAQWRTKQCDYILSAMVVKVNVLGQDMMVDREPHGPSSGGTQLEIFIRALPSGLEERSCYVQFGQLPKASGTCKQYQSSGASITSLTVTTPQAPANMGSVIAKMGYDEGAVLTWVDTAVFFFRYETVSPPTLLHFFPAFGPSAGTLVHVGASGFSTIAANESMKITDDCGMDISQEARDIIPDLFTDDLHEMTGDIFFRFDMPALEASSFAPPNLEKVCSGSIMHEASGKSVGFTFTYYPPEKPVVRSVVPDYGKVRTRVPVELEVSNYIWSDMASTPASAECDNGWKPFPPILKFGGLTANCCARSGLEGSSTMFRCLTPALPILHGGVREVLITLPDTGNDGSTMHRAIGSFGIAGRVMLSSLKKVSSAEEAFDASFSYGPILPFDVPDDQHVGPAAVLTKAKSTMVFEVLGLNERIVSAADISLVLSSGQETITLGSATILGSSDDILRVMAELDLLDGHEGVFDANFYVRGEFVATRKNALQAGLTLPGPVSLIYTGDDAFIRFATVSAGPMSGGTNVEVDIGGNFPVTGAVTVSMKEETSVLLTDVFWTSRPGSTTVYFKTMPWVSGIARIEIEASLDKKVLMLFEFVPDEVAIEFVQPRYGNRAGFPFAVGLSGLTSTVTSSFFEVHVGAIQVQVKDITAESNYHLIHFDAPAVATAGEQPLVINIVKGKPQVLVHHIEYLENANAPEVVIVTPSVFPLAGGIRVRLMLSGLPIASNPGDMTLEIHDEDQVNRIVAVEIDSPTFLSTATGTALEFDCPDLSMFGEGAVTLKIWGCPDQDCQFAMKAIEVQDEMRVRIVDFTPRTSAIAGGTSIMIRLKGQGLKNIARHELQIVGSTTRLAVDEIVDQDPFTGITLARFTTLPDAAGDVTFSVVPYGLTSERFAPTFEITYDVNVGAQVTSLPQETLPVEDPSVVSLYPSAGNVHGGYLVTAYVSQAPADLVLENVRVLFAGKHSVPVQTSLDDSSSVLKVVTEAPSYVVGIASFSIYFNGSPSASQAPATALFAFVSDVGISVLGSPVPAAGPSEGGTPVAVTVKNCPAGLSASSFVVDAGGHSCAVKKVLYEQPEVCSVYFRTGRVSVPGKKRCSVMLKLSSATGGPRQFSADFSFQFHAARTEPSISFAFPTEGSAGGSTPVLVILESIKLEHLSRDAAVVRVGGEYAEVEAVKPLSETSAEIAFISPAFPCSSVVCRQPVQITSLLNPDIQLRFQFEYHSQIAYVSEVLPSRCPDSGGSIMSVTIKNFPVVYFVDEVEVHANGLESVMEPSSIIASDPSMTVLEIACPASPSQTLSPNSPGSLNIQLVPVFKKEKVASFSVDVVKMSSPSLVSFAPSSGPSGHPTLVHVVVDRYPVRPPGSLDKNFKPISGPVPARVRINGMALDPNSVVGYSILQGGARTENTRTQIAFLFQSELPGRAQVELGLDMLPWNPLVSFSIDVYNASVPTLLYLNPSSGPTSGGTVLVDIGSFGPPNVNNIDQVVATVDGQFCDVVGLKTYGFITSLRLQLPAAIRSKTAVVTVSAGSASPAVEFVFVYADACNYDSYCARIGMIPDVNALIRLAPKLQCDPGLCVTREDKPLPVVLPGGSREGLTEGGDIIRILVSDLESFQSSDVIVSFAGVASPSVTLQTIDADVVQLSIVTPPFHSAGTVEALVETLHRPSVSAKFSFTYQEMPVGIGSVTFSPSECFAGETVDFTAIVIGWSPVASDSTVQLNSTNLANNVFISSSQVVRSTWQHTKFVFKHMCARPLTGELSSFTAMHPTAGLLATGAITVKERLFALNSVFPSRGPAGGGYAILVTFTGAVNPPIENREDIVKTFAKYGNTSVDLTCSVRSIGNGTGVIGVTLPQMTAGAVDFVVVPKYYPNTTFSFVAEAHYEGEGPPLLLSASPLTGSKYGGTIVTVKVAGMDASAIDIKQRNSIVVRFGSKQAVVRTIRKATIDLTVLEVVAPAGFSGLSVTVSVTPAALTAFADASVSFTYTYVNPPAELSIKRGSIEGGTRLNATVYGFPLMNLQSNIGTLGVRFGSTPGKVIRIVRSEVDSAVVELGVPPVSSTGVVDVVVTALLSEGQKSSRTTYEYFEKPSIEAVNPVSGPKEGGFIIRLSVKHFPVVYSVTQVVFSCAKVRGTVSEIIFSNAEHTSFELIAPSLTSAGSTSCLLEPLDRTLRAESAVRFEYDALTVTANVMIEEEEPILAYTETKRHLTVFGLDPILEHGKPMLRFEVPGKGRYTLGGISGGILHSDDMSSKILIVIPAMPPGVYLAEIFWGYSSALFTFEVKQSKITAYTIAGSEGPATGGTMMTIAVHGISQSLSPEAYAVRFGSQFGVVTRVEVYKNTTRLDVASPQYIGPVKDGNAVVIVEGYAKEDPSNGFGLHFIYHRFEVESVMLSTHGNSFVVSFNQDTTHESLQAPCSAYFDAATVLKLGSGPSCYWFAPRHLTVYLGSGASIIPGDAGRLLNFRHAHDAKGPVPSSLPFTLEGNQLPLVPTGKIVGPSQLSRCDSAMFTAIGPSARKLDYTWSVSESSPDDTQQILQTLLSGVHGDRVEIDATELDAGVVYTIAVEVTNFLGISATFEKTFEIVDEPIPTAYLQNPDYFTGTSPFSFGVRASGSKCMAAKQDLSTCTFDFHMGTVPSDLRYAWFKTVDGIATQEYEDISGSQFTEKVPLPGKYVTYEVEVFSENYAAVFALLSTTVFVRPSKLQAIIYGADRVASVSGAIELTGRGSFDPDVMNSDALSFSWTCSLEGTPCRSPDEQLLLFPNQPDVSIAPNMLHAGEVYEIELTVSSPDGRVGTTVVALHTSTERIHVVSITRELDRLDPGHMISTFNMGESFLLVAETMPGDPRLVWTGDPSVEWNVDHPAVSILDRDQFPLGASQSVLEVSGDVLKPGSDYVFTASLLNSVGSGFYRIRKEQINVGPNGGSCKIEPATGFALKTEFLASCQGFEDPDGIDRLYFKLKGADGEIAFPGTSMSEMEFPVLDVGTFVVEVTIKDQKGASVTLETNEVTVTQEDVESQDVLLRCNELLDEAKARNDLTTVLLNLAAVSRALERVKDETDPNGFLSTGVSETAERMSDVLLDFTRRNEIDPKQAIFILEGVDQILIDYAILSVASVHNLGVLLTPISQYDVLGMANVGSGFMELTVNVLEKLSKRARILRMSDELGEEEETTIENLLQQLADVALKAGLVFEDTVVQEVCNPDVVLFGTRMRMQDVKGAAFSLPCHPYLTESSPRLISAAFPDSLSLAGAEANDIVDVQLSYRKDLVAIGSNQTGLQIVSGAVGVTLSSAESHTVNQIDVGQGAVEITVPVNTSALSDEDTDTFFDGHKVQCVYWKDTSMTTTRLDFGRWSNLGCKATSFSRQLDDRGAPIKSLGFVTCQCNHLTHFAVGFGETKVRFKQDPTAPRHNDLFEVQSGDMVAFDVETLNELSTGTVQVDVLSITPAGRSFPQGDPTLTAESSNVYKFKWIPRDAGTYRIEIELKVDEDLVDTKTYYVRVLFCEHFLRSGETLQDVAIRYDMPWQTLFAINPHIQNPRVLKAEPYSRTWMCNNGNCVLESHTDGTLVKIGRLYTVQQAQTLVDVVNVTRSSFTQLKRHNLKRLHMEGTQVYDIMHRHNAMGLEVSYVGEEFCVVSKLADESCLV